MFLSSACVPSRRWAEILLAYLPFFRKPSQWVMFAPPWNLGPWDPEAGPPPPGPVYSSSTTPDIPMPPSPCTSWSPCSKHSWVFSLGCGCSPSFPNTLQPPLKLLLVSFSVPFGHFHLSFACRLPLLNTLCTL